MKAEKKTNNMSVFFISLVSIPGRRGKNLPERERRGANKRGDKFLRLNKKNYIHMYMYYWIYIILLYFVTRISFIV